MRLLDGAEARAIERLAIAQLGIAGPVLMENAALAVAEVIEHRFPGARRIAIVCGGGNNGGDGLALARQLATRGTAVVALLCARGEDVHGDAAAQLSALRALRAASGGAGAGREVDLREIDEGSLDVARGLLARADLVVDALFGIGLSRPLSGWRADLVTAMNEARAPRLAVDVPSGLDAGASERDAASSEVVGPHVRADVTVTFFAPKRALLLLPAGESAGEVWSSPLSVPPAAL